MTKHIEDARKLEPVAFIVPEALHELEKHSAASATVWSGKATHRFVKDACPLVRLSDAQAALTAAEERGRIEERERCASEADGVGSDDAMRIARQAAREIEAGASIYLVVLGAIANATRLANDSGLAVQYHQQQHDKLMQASLESLRNNNPAYAQSEERRALWHIKCANEIAAITKEPTP